MNVKIRVSPSMPGIDAIVKACNGDYTEPEFDVWRKQTTSRYETFVRRRFDAFGRGGGDWPALAVSTVQARRGPAKGRAGKGGGLGGGVGARSSLARDTQRGSVLVSAGGTFTILSDTGLLRGALTIGARGNFTGSTPKGMEFGFDGTPHAGTLADTLSQKSRDLFAQAARGGLSEKSYKRIRGKGIAARGDAVKAERRARGKQPASIAQIAGWHNSGTKRMPQRLILAQPDPQTAKGMSADLTRAIVKIGQRGARSPGGKL